MPARACARRSWRVRRDGHDAVERARTSLQARALLGQQPKRIAPIRSGSAFRRASRICAGRVVAEAIAAATRVTRAGGSSTVPAPCECEPHAPATTCTVRYPTRPRGRAARGSALRPPLGRRRSRTTASTAQVRRGADRAIVTVRGSGHERREHRGAASTACHREHDLRTARKRMPPPNDALESDREAPAVGRGRARPLLGPSPSPAFREAVTTPAAEARDAAPLRATCSSRPRGWRPSCSARSLPRCNAV